MESRGSGRVDRIFACSSMSSRIWRTTELRALELETRHSLELASVQRRKGPPQRNRRGGDDQVVRAEGRSSRGELRPQRGMNSRDRKAEGDGGDHGEHAFDERLSRWPMTGVSPQHAL